MKASEIRKKQSHNVYKIRCHMVTVGKYRKVLLNGKVEEAIRETMQEISERYEISINEIGFGQIPPPLAVGSFILDSLGATITCL